jgi:hypothetical protein
MVRHRGKKSLYEVMGRVVSKPSPDKSLEQTYGQQDGVDESGAKITAGIAKWPKKPKIVQLNVDRINISVSYQLAIAIILGLILLVLVVFRLGQLSRIGEEKPVETESGIVEMPKAVAAAAKRSEPAAVGEVAAEARPIVSKGNNRIVIQTYLLRAHLEPVRRYFAQFGIETEIRKIDDWYYLVTKEKYENPEKPGTDGYIAKQRIIEIGAKYKAPQGYESFGTRPFYDAYGKRFDD